MALENESSTKTDNDDDDLGCYFLQPSSSPYNITEKVQQANLDLFNSTLETARSIKVKFREELVSFEPDLTDDDVNSIESDQVEEDQGIIEKVPDSTDNMSAYSTVLRENISLEDTEEEEEEVGEAFVEEILSSDDDGEIQEEGSFRQSEYVAESKVSNELRKGNVEDQIDQKAEKRKNKGRKGSKRTEINCKDHCIEQVDSRLSMLIKKLDIQEKPVVNLPPLQLHQRHCCDDTKSSHSFRNLPNYNGYRSEYGLSYRQLKNKHKHIETIRQKEMARQKLIEEYRIMKVQQNESVFCQWLKEVSRRNRQKREINRENKLRLKSVGFQPQTPLKCLSPNVVNINQSLMRQERDRVRPKTAGFNEFVPKGHIKKKRPSTTQSCVYIELPKSVLKKGIYIGDLLITNSKKISKKLHILTIATIMPTVILGGGISGLTAAYYLLKKNCTSIALLEASNRFGGWIKSNKQKNDSIFEEGPRTIRPRGNPGINTLNLIDDLGLSENILPIKNDSAVARNRMIYAGGELHSLPNTFRLNN
ncbi:hypothetical protein GWI33_004427 [Rhynchophorus ferrugineus]|uniref:Amine oxidase domain-containing protein n=1 Tax=Rhynchophorus ferrugineus TaxID=354439 RepID=A0A834MEP7_RHYFE|nr:hypothetical protein GWI33_004427 [Rhynchophorus ferrugineus]